MPVLRTGPRSFISFYECHELSYVWIVCVCQRERKRLMQCHSLDMSADSVISSSIEFADVRNAWEQSFQPPYVWTYCHLPYFLLLPQIILIYIFSITSMCHPIFSFFNANINNGESIGGYCCLCEPLGIVVSFETLNWGLFVRIFPLINICGAIKVKHNFNRSVCNRKLWPPS